MKIVIASVADEYKAAIRKAFIDKFGREPTKEELQELLHSEDNDFQFFDWQGATKQQETAIIRDLMQLWEALHDPERIKSIHKTIKNVRIKIRHINDQLDNLKGKRSPQATASRLRLNTKLAYERKDLKRWLSYL